MTLKLRYANFETLDRGRTGPATHRESEVYRTVLELLRANRHQHRAVRLVGVQLSNLVGENTQLSLPLGHDQPERVETAIDGIRDKFGYEAIVLGKVDGSGGWLA